MSKKFKVTMKRVYTTTVEVEVEDRNELLIILHDQENHPDQVKVDVFYDDLWEKELSQCKIGKEKYTIKELN